MRSRAGLKVGDAARQLRWAARSSLRSPAAPPTLPPAARSPALEPRRSPPGAREAGPRCSRPRRATGIASRRRGRRARRSRRLRRPAGDPRRRLCGAAAPTCPKAGGPRSPGKDEDEQRPAGLPRRKAAAASAPRAERHRRRRRRAATGARSRPRGRIASAARGRTRGVEDGPRAVTSAASSAASRVLPIPGGPETSATRAARLGLLPALAQPAQLALAPGEQRRAALQLGRQLRRSAAARRGGVLGEDRSWSRRSSGPGSIPISSPSVRRARR